MEKILFRFFSSFFSFFEMAKQNGSVKWFDSTKGFGFVTPEDGSPDVFVHQTSIYSEGFRSLAEGEKVEYDLIEEGGRTKAINVTGPNGAFVRGTPKPSGGDYSDNAGGGGGGRGGRRGYDNAGSGYERQERSDRGGGGRGGGRGGRGGYGGDSYGGSGGGGYNGGGGGGYSQQQYGGGGQGYSQQGGYGQQQGYSGGGGGGYQGGYQRNERSNSGGYRRDDRSSGPVDQY